MSEKITTSQQSVRIPFPASVKARAEESDAAQVAANRDPVTKKPTMAPALQERINQTLRAASAVPQNDVPTPPPEILGHINPMHGAAAAAPRQQHALASAALPNTPNANPTDLSIVLPSNFHFYQFKDLYTGPMRQLHLAKLAVSHETNSLAPMVEAVSSMLSTTHADFQGSPLGWMLTIPDFYYVLYYHRLNSFTKAAFVHHSECQNPKHLEEVQIGVRGEDGQLLVGGDGQVIRKAPESRKIDTLVQKSTLTTRMLEAPVLYDEANVPEGTFLYPSTMKDAVDFTDHPRFHDSEWRATAALACVVRLYDKPNATLDERVYVLNQFSPDEIHEVRAFQNVAEKSYGVEEWINVICKECGHSTRAKVRINAHSFLSA